MWFGGDGGSKKKKRQKAEVEAAVNVSIGGDRDGEDGKW